MDIYSSYFYFYYLCDFFKKGNKKGNFLLKTY